jgi:XTP/dITP diphosphohydrolase
MNTIDEKLAAFRKLLEIMDQLREECPWDRKQTNETLRNLTIEETYELADAVTENKPQEIMNELGDLMLHIVFYAKIGSEQDDFDIGDVINSLNKKLIYRHPHVFGEIKVKDHEDVKRNWEELKMREGRTVLGGVPVNLPAMIKANRIQDKVKAVGFDWEEKSQIWEKVNEELSELKKEVETGNIMGMESEFGDLIFSVINAARLYGIDPETALEKTNKKFIKRFNWLEKETRAMGKSLKEMTLEEMNKIWESAKEND